MRVDGIGSPKNTTQKLSGPRRRSLLPSLTTVRYTSLVCFILLFCLQTHTDQLFLILYRELYYRHVYSRLQPDIDDRFHSYENSCELFNYLLSSICHLLHSRSTQVMRSQIRRMVLYHFSFRNSGCGTLSTSLSTNSSPSTCGVQKSRPRQRKN